MVRRIGVLALLVSGVLLLRTVRTWFAVRVAGESMMPTLRPGELLAVRPPGPGEPVAGQIVVARMGGREVVKRVGVAPGRLPDGSLWLTGDNRTRSTDSWASGPVVRAAIVGVVRACYWPLSRIRVLRG
ncbi:MAG TPA: S24/S26 family peptidase [Actinomycetota bacterium]|jgi:phage repressor protein C with HTH and peptisase S24 domain